MRRGNSLSGLARFHQPREPGQPTKQVTELLAGLLNEAGEVKILRGGGEGGAGESCH